MRCIVSRGTTFRMSEKIGNLVAEGGNRNMKQHFINDENYESEVSSILKENNVKSILLVCGHSIEQLDLNQLFCDLPTNLNINVTRFMDFEPNPRYESTLAGVKVFHENDCDFIIAVGGGSALDVAKCIKMFHSMDEKKNYLEQEIIPNDTKLLAIPTTAGTGSESTKFSIIYLNGEKQSVNEVSSLPDYVLLHPDVLLSLPDYQKKATMMDALCHAIESYWSVKSSKVSKEYARIAICDIMQNADDYLQNMETGNKAMLDAANIAGQAINRTQTTAAHAMCYKITTLYGVSHGHAALICLTKIWRYMLKNMDCCNDPRGSEYLSTTFSEIAAFMGCDSTEHAIDKLEQLTQNFGLETPKLQSIDELYKLVKSVNVDRLQNHPIRFEEIDLIRIYNQIFGL